MSFLPAVVRAQYKGAYRIHLVFNDGAEGTVAFRRWLKGPVFGPLLDLDYFRRFFVDGATVAWPNGADIAPETLYAATVAKTRPNKSLQLSKARRSSVGKRAARSRLRS
jgi:hypothetical protein